MKLEQAIEKAIVGGWDDCGFISSSNFPNGWCAVRVTLGGYVAIQRTRKDGTPGRWSEIGKQDKILLDPLFWQCLGTAMGWKKWECDCGEQYEMQGIIICPLCNEQGARESWRQRWHRLIDHLAEGKSVESFFANL